MTVRELLEQFTEHFVKCKACKIAQACPEGVRLRKVYDDAFEARQIRDMGDKAITKAPAPVVQAESGPSPYTLWKMAGENRTTYMALMIHHGYAVQRAPLSLWVVARNGEKFTVQRQPVDETIAPSDPIEALSLQQARDCIPENHTRMTPEPGDNPDIIESWAPNELL